LLRHNTKAPYAISDLSYKSEGVSWPPDPAFPSPLTTTKALINTTDCLVEGHDKKFWRFAPDVCPPPQFKIRSGATGDYDVIVPNDQKILLNRIKTCQW